MADIAAIVAKRTGDRQPSCIRIRPDDPETVTVWRMIIAFHHVNPIWRRRNPAPSSRRRGGD
jgi:hypothetical protein